MLRPFLQGGTSRVPPARRSAWPVAEVCVLHQLVRTGAMEAPGWRGIMAKQQQAMVHPGTAIPDYSQVWLIRMRNGGRTRSGGMKGVFPIDDRIGDSS